MKPVKDSEILRAARRRIELYQRDYICYAINDVCMGTVKQKTALMRWVQDMLQGSYTYSSWLRVYHPDIHTQMFHTKGSFRKGRLAWLDWMIEQCEKEEAL